jgi:hypothetical protein
VTTDQVLLEGAALDRGLGMVRVRAVAQDGGNLFVGITTADDAAAYLAGVQHTVVTGPGRDDVRQVPGGPPATLPQATDIWLKSSAGPGLQTVRTVPEPGTWVAVIMPLDATAGVRASVDVGATLPWLGPVSVAVLVVAVLLLAAGAVAITLAVRAATVRRQA